MGYDLHITRAEDWSNNLGCEISRAEWLEILASDPELKLAPEIGDDYAVWTASGQNPAPWLHWNAGDILAKYPDEATVAKMLQLARRLGARVQGDDGEFY